MSDWDDGMKELTEEEIEVISARADAIVDQKVFYRQLSIFSMS